MGHLRVFGSLAYALKPSTVLKKLDPRSSRYIFVGYDSGTHGYRLFDPVTKRISVRRDVVFDESRTGAFLLRQRSGSHHQAFTIRHTSLSFLYFTRSSLAIAEVVQRKVVARRRATLLLPLQRKAMAARRVTLFSIHRMKTLLVLLQLAASRTGTASSLAIGEVLQRKVVVYPLFPLMTVLMMMGLGVATIVLISHHLLLLLLLYHSPAITIGPCRRILLLYLSMRPTSSMLASPERCRKLYLALMLQSGCLLSLLS